ncbi:MAG TPA: HyaD/HybD family hydrogenase maturation endopeptidase [Terriglobales bacterium]|nr:HyaD/HybD family hydrogenase maturation endopeptidase [Terriglobales bacterium]
MPAPATCVVLGLGNTLHSDDGVGPQAIERLRSDARVPVDVALIEGGTLGLELLSYIWDCSYLLVLDAVDVGQPPGTLVRMSSQEVQTLTSQGSVHQLGVADLLVALRVLASRTPEVVLLGVQPASTEWGTELSPAVAAVLPALADAAVAELGRRPHTQAEIPA